MKKLVISVPDGIALDIDANLTIRRDDGKPVTEKEKRNMVEGCPAKFRRMNVSLAPYGRNGFETECGYGVSYALTIEDEDAKDPDADGGVLKKQEAEPEKAEEAAKKQEEKAPEKWKDGEPVVEYWRPLIRNTEGAADLEKLRMKEGLSRSEMGQVIDACMEDVMERFIERMDRIFDI